MASARSNRVTSQFNPNDPRLHLSRPGPSTMSMMNGRCSLKQGKVTVQPKRCLLAALEPWPLTVSMKIGRCSIKQCNVTVCITSSVRSSYVPPWYPPPPPQTQTKKKTKTKKHGRNSHSNRSTTSKSDTNDARTYLFSLTLWVLNTTLKRNDRNSFKQANGQSQTRTMPVRYLVAGSSTTAVNEEEAQELIQTG